MTPAALGGLFAAGLVGGAMNAIAGGGSFVTFPALVLAGLPPVVANASSTVALFPGGMSSSWAFRRDLRRVFVGLPLVTLALVSAAGGLAGALLLLWTPQRTFDAVIPWVLLLATLTFAFGRAVGSRLPARFRGGPAALLLVQLVLGTYGGYFGGAVGIMMMAAWTLLTREDVMAMTRHRSVLVNAANASAVLCFMASGAVAWAATGCLLAGAVLGGYAGARLTDRLDARVVRGAVIALSALVTIGFFARLL